MKRSITIIVALAGAALWTGAANPQALAPATDWADKPIPLEVFGQFPQIDTPRISPDGKWIAMKVRSGGEQVLALKEVGPGKPEIIARNSPAEGDKAGAREVRNWLWLDPDHLLISLASRDNLYGKWFDNIRYVAYNRATHRSVPLGWDTSLGSTQVLWASRDGPPHVLLQRRSVANGTEQFDSPEVIDVDADTGKYRTVQRTNPLVGSWSTDEGGVVRFGVGGDADTGRERILYRPDATSNFSTIFNDVVDRFHPPEMPDMMLTGAGAGKAYATSRVSGFNALYEYDLKTMKLGKKVFDVPGYDIDGAATLAGGETLAGVAVTETRGHMVYFDPRLKEIQQVLEETYGKGNVAIESTDRARRMIVFRVGALGQAPVYFVFNTDTGGTGRLAFYNETLRNAVVNPVSTIRYKASDGKEIEAILTMPRHRAGQKNLPLIVMPHGGPWARDDADWNAYQWEQALAELGYVVIQPNYRGSSGYGRDWEKAADGNWGYRMQDDLNDAVAYLAAQGIADPKRVCMMGWSYGGYAAARAAQRDGKLYRCAISGAGPTDMPAMVAYDKDYLGRYGAKTGLGAAGNLADISPSLHAEQVSIPILIVQGAKDERVPVAQARSFVARLKKAGKVEGRDFVYLEQPLNTHHLLREPDRVQLLQAMKSFLDKNNPA